MVETTRWERVRWDCPHCDGHVWPKDSVDYVDHAELVDDTSKGVADETVVACDTCNTVFDVHFDARYDGEQDVDLSFGISFVEHESRVTIGLWTVGDHPIDSEQIDSASIGGQDLPAEEVQHAWEDEVVEYADMIHEERRKQDKGDDETINPSELDRETLRQVKKAVNGFSATAPSRPSHELSSHRQGKHDAYSSVMAMLTKWLEEQDE